MVESRMAEDETGRPSRFSPEWPPKPVVKAMPANFHGASLVFKKSGWPPATDDDVNTENVEGSSAGSPNNPDAVQNNNNSSPQQTSDNISNQNSISNPVKPKRAVVDYSQFFGKNAAPPTKPVYVLQPDRLTIPEKFSGNSEEE